MWTDINRQGHELLLFPPVKNNFSPSFRFSLFFWAEKTLIELFRKHCCSLLLTSLKNFIDVNNLLTSTSQHTFLVRFCSSMAPERHIIIWSPHARAHRSIDCVHMHRSTSDSAFVLIYFSSPVRSFSTSTFTLLRYCFFSFAHTHTLIQTWPPHRFYLIFRERMDRRAGW